jgi:hypothetical protein
MGGALPNNRVKQTKSKPWHNRGVAFAAYAGRSPGMAAMMAPKEREAQQAQLVLARRSAGSSGSRACGPFQVRRPRISSRGAEITAGATCANMVAAITGGTWRWGESMWRSGKLGCRTTR